MLLLHSVTSWLCAITMGDFDSASCHEHQSLCCQDIWSAENGSYRQTHTLLVSEAALQEQLCYATSPVCQIAHISGFGASLQDLAPVQPITAKAAVHRWEQAPWCQSSCCQETHPGPAPGSHVAPVTDQLWWLHECTSSSRGHTRCPLLKDHCTALPKHRSSVSPA